MADFRKMIPFVILWETGVVQKKGETNEALFSRAKLSKGGFTNDPDDKGGATCIGVTLGTFQTYMAKKGVRAVTASELKSISYESWLEILKKMYWDRWKADSINDQSVAEILVDWVWGSGKWGIVIPQRILGVKEDGIVGPKTLEAVNSFDPLSFFQAVKSERIEFYHDIVKKTPSQQKFLNGWINRTNDHVYIKY